MSHNASEISAILVPALRRARRAQLRSAFAEAEAMLPCVVLTAASAPSARRVADLIPPAGSALHDGQFAEVGGRNAQIVAGHDPSSLTSILRWCPGRRPGVNCPNPT